MPDLTGPDIRAFRERHPRPSGKPMARARLAALLGLPSPKTGGKITVGRWEAGDQSPAPYLPLALAELERRLAAG